MEMPYHSSLKRARTPFSRRWPCISRSTPRTSHCASSSRPQAVSNGPHCHTNTLRRSATAHAHHFTTSALHLSVICIPFAPRLFQTRHLLHGLANGMVLLSLPHSNLIRIKNIENLSSYLSWGCRNCLDGNTTRGKRMMRFLCIVPSIFNFLHLRRQLPCSIALNHPVAPLWCGGRAKRVTAIAATAAVARLCTLHCVAGCPFPISVLRFKLPCHDTDETGLKIVRFG